MQTDHAALLARYDAARSVGGWIWRGVRSGRIEPGQAAAVMCDADKLLRVVRVRYRDQTANRDTGPGPSSDEVRAMIEALYPGPDNPDPAEILIAVQRAYETGRLRIDADRWRCGRCCAPNPCAVLVCGACGR